MNVIESVELGGEGEELASGTGGATSGAGTSLGGGDERVFTKRFSRRFYQTIDNAMDFTGTTNSGDHVLSDEGVYLLPWIYPKASISPRQFDEASRGCAAMALKSMGFNIKNTRPLVESIGARQQALVVDSTLPTVGLNVWVVKDTSGELVRMVEDPTGTKNFDTVNNNFENTPFIQNWEEGKLVRCNINLGKEFRESLTTGNGADSENMPPLGTFSLFNGYPVSTFPAQGGTYSHSWHATKRIYPISTFKDMNPAMNMWNNTSNIQVPGAREIQYWTEVNSQYHHPPPTILMTGEKIWVPGTDSVLNFGIQMEVEYWSEWEFYRGNSDALQTLNIGPIPTRADGWKANSYLYPLQYQIQTDRHYHSYAQEIQLNHPPTTPCKQRQVKRKHQVCHLHLFSMTLVTSTPL